MVKLVPTGKKVEPQGGFGTAFTGGAAERLIDNTLGIPEAVARAGQGAVNVGRGILGQEPILRQQGESILGLPSGRDVLSGAQALPGLLSGNFGEQFQGAQNQRKQIAQQNPGAAGLGGFVGDAATIATGRAPLLRGTAGTATQAARAPRVGGMFDEPISRGLSALGSRVGRNAPTATGRKAIENVLRNDTVRELARGAGRSLETGLEGAVLSMIQDGDPVETAAIAAGGQLLTSASLGVASESFDFLKSLGLNPKGVKGKAASAVALAGAMGGIFNMFEQITPGGNNFSLQSDERANKKVAFGILAGATLGLLGKRAKPGGAFEGFPLFADTVATLGRTGIIKTAQSLSEDPAARATVERVWQNPQSFTLKQLSKFNDAASSENPAEEINRLLEQDESFRQRINAPDPRLADVPVKEDE